MRSTPGGENGKGPEVEPTQVGTTVTGLRGSAALPSFPFLIGRPIRSCVHLENSVASRAHSIQRNRECLGLDNWLNKGRVVPFACPVSLLFSGTSFLHISLPPAPHHPESLGLTLGSRVPASSLCSYHLPWVVHMSSSYINNVAKEMEPQEYEVTKTVGEGCCPQRKIRVPSPEGGEMDTGWARITNDLQVSGLF